MRYYSHYIHHEYSLRKCFSAYRARTAARAPSRPTYELAGRLMTSPALPEDEDEVPEADAPEAVPVPELLVLAKVVVMVELPEVMVETTEVTEAEALLSLSAAPVLVGVPAVPL